MNIDELTLKQIKEIQSLNFNNQSSTLNTQLGEKVIIRTYSAGVWFGKLIEKSGNEVILQDARRMWLWKAAESISLSGCAIYGINQKESKIVEPVEKAWLEAIEIISCSSKSIQSIQEAPHAKAQ